jgi:hypothetical protein
MFTHDTARAAMSGLFVAASLVAEDGTKVWAAYDICKSMDVVGVCSTRGGAAFHVLLN